MNEMKFCTATLFIVPLAFCIVSGCFITNCPVGGKRATGANVKLKALRQCSVCGPKGVGRCYGPQICCGPQMGCHIDSRDNFVCQLESAYPVPCENQFASPCGETFDGRCAADGVCCSTDHCILEENCKSGRDASGSQIYSNTAASDFILYKDGMQPSLGGSSARLE